MAWDPAVPESPITQLLPHGRGGKSLCAVADRQRRALTGNGSENRATEGLSKLEIIRCLKRYVAREVFPLVRAVSELNQRVETAA